MVADIILPVPVDGTFSYAVPPEMRAEARPGLRVAVQFGQRRILTGVIREIHPASDTKNLKTLLEILDDQVLITSQQFAFWDWLSEYYMCSLGEVLLAALPVAFRLASETSLQIHPDFDGNLDSLSPVEQRVVEALAMQESLTLTQVSEVAKLGKVVNLVRSLIHKNVVLVKEELQERYKEKTETVFFLAEGYHSETALTGLLNVLSERAPKQMEVLMCWLQEAGIPKDTWDVCVPGRLLNRVSGHAAAVAALTRKHVLIKETQVVSRLKRIEAKASSGDIQLSQVQEVALNELWENWKEKDVNLLFGVTGSGKTEIYIKLIRDFINSGKQVLYLLPEIALTTQIIERLQHYFGDVVGIYHSRYNESERAEVWQAVLGFQSDASPQVRQVILGARSSLFLPYTDLGLVIIDEEHDPSFKQTDPAPRYNARDAALWLARHHGAKVVMGSATPAVETYAHAKAGRFGLVEIKKRYMNQLLPEILVADIREETKKKRMYSHFSGLMLEHIEEALREGEQVIMFQNRRGFALRLVCDLCHWMPQCLNCDVTLIYHKKERHLRCHYCGYVMPIPSRCPACSSTKLLMKGFGTEKIEDELKAFLPKAVIARMDLDTTRSKQAYHHFIQEFSAGRIDILVGTQMVTKGLDFDNVSTVGVLNADHMLSFPDFRASERSYQLMAQVSGRSGRKGKRGKVIIQTSQPYHTIIRQVIDNNYEGMYKDQMTERNKFDYPPFSRLIQIRLQFREASVLDEAADWLAAELGKTLGKRVLGPEYPMVSRIRNEFIKHILVKINRNESVKEAKRRIRKCLENMVLIPVIRRVRVIIDVDPV